MKYDLSKLFGKNICVTLIIYSVIFHSWISYFEFFSMKNKRLDHEQ